jgi:hypothetical protein
VSFDYLANLRKLKKNFFGGWAGVMKREVLINEKPNQGIWETKKVGNSWSRQLAHRWQQGCQPYTLAELYSPETFLFRFWYSFLLEAE